MNWEEFRLSKRLNFSGAETAELYRLLADIDSVKKGWGIVGKFQPATVDRFIQSVIVTSTGASNRIEGNRLSDEEVEELYHNLRIQKLKTRDEQEVAGYLEMLQLIFGNLAELELNESLILDFHSKMLRHCEKDERHRGRYKFGSNRVEAKDAAGNVIGVIFDPTPPHLVEKEIRELLDWYLWARENEFRHPLLLLGNFLFEYLAIHPFQDGNGRTSRLLTNFLLLKEGYEFAKVISHEKLIEGNKADYYRALNVTQRSWKTENEDIAPWIRFFLTTLSIQANKALELLEAEDEEELLSLNQRRVLDVAVRSGSDGFNRGQIIKELSLAPSTAEKAIRKLVAMGKVEKFGQGRGTRYRVVQ